MGGRTEACAPAAARWRHKKKEGRTPPPPPPAASRPLPQAEAGCHVGAYCPSYHTERCARSRETSPTDYKDCCSEQEVVAGVVPGSVSPPRGGGGAAEFVAGSSGRAFRRTRRRRLPRRRTLRPGGGGADQRGLHRSQERGGRHPGLGRGRLPIEPRVRCPPQIVWDFPRRARSPIVGTLGTDSGRLERSLRGPLGLKGWALGRLRLKRLKTGLGPF